MHSNDIAPVFIMLIMFGSIVLLAWKYLENKHKTNMSLIEKGFKPDENPLNFKPLQKRFNSLRSLQFGLVIAFIGIGTLIGIVIQQSYYSDILLKTNFENSDQFYYARNHLDGVRGGIMFASIAISGGLGLILFYFIAQKKNKEEMKKS